MKKDIKLDVIPEPEENTRSVFVIEKKGAPLLAGNGDFNYLCGNCNTILADGIILGRIENLVIKCITCNSFNNIP